MTDTNTNEPQNNGELDPAIWDNPTLGAASHGVFLDQVEKQQLENRAALIEDRPARIVKRENRYPGYVPDNPNDPSVTFGSTHADGSDVIPVIPAPETGYDRYDYGDEEVSSKGSTEEAKADKVATTKTVGKTTSK